VSYKYYPNTKYELIWAMKKEIFEIQGIKNNPNWKADLNCIDTSRINDMSYLFCSSFQEGYGLHEFNGNISGWDVGNVKSTAYMFSGSNFNGDISKWDVGKIEYMSGMFEDSKFNNDISKWNVGNVKNMGWMFYNAEFNQDISQWNVNNVTDMYYMFAYSKFSGNISEWNISNVVDMAFMFFNSKFSSDIGKWELNRNIRLDCIFDGCPLSEIKKGKLIIRELIKNNRNVNKKALKELEKYIDEELKSRHIKNKRIKPKSPTRDL